jgi:outer membrane murein-binding lipoprotein Lpp
MQATLVSSSAVANTSGTVQLALFKADGTPKVIANPAAAQVDTVAADLAALKVDFNALLAKLRAAGVMLP